MEATSTVAPPDGSIYELVEHVVEKHHEYLRAEFPKLRALSAKVRAAGDPRLAELHEVLGGFAQELLRHLDKEEHLLFPMCVELGDGRRPRMPPSVRMPISRMLEEHKDHVRDVERLSALTDGFAEQSVGGEDHVALVRGLRELEADLRVHIDTEERLLFPWALRLEQELG